VLRVHAVAGRPWLSSVKQSVHSMGMGGGGQSVGSLYAVAEGYKKDLRDARL